MANMVAEGFEKSLDALNFIRWISIPVTLSMRFFGPGSTNLVILGQSISAQDARYIIPSVLLAFYSARLVIIVHLATIAKQYGNKRELKELVACYPTPEFMRWRSRNPFICFLLSVFLLFSDLLPTILYGDMLFVLWRSGQSIDTYYYLLQIVLLGIAIFNWRYMGSRIYVPLAGRPAIRDYITS